MSLWLNGLFPLRQCFAVFRNTAPNVIFFRSSVVKEIDATKKSENSTEAQVKHKETQ